MLPCENKANLRIMFVSGLWLLSTIGGSLASTCNTICSVKNDDRGSETTITCGFQYYTSTECSTEKVDNFRVDDTRSTFESNINQLHVKTWPIDTVNAAVDLSVRVNFTGKVALMLSGMTDRRLKRCLIVCFDVLPKRELGSLKLNQPFNPPDWQLTTLKANCVRLPNGEYNATVIAYSGTQKGSGFCATLKDDLLSSRREVSILSHSKFPVQFDYEKLLNRSKRVGEMRTTLSMQDLLWSLDDMRDMPRCYCYSCLNAHHIYNNETALLQLSYDVNDTAECCANCSSLNLVLYQYITVENETSCTDLDFTTYVIGGLRLVMPEKNVTQGPVEYPNIGSGCYTFRLRPMVNPSPIYHGFFWLESHGNVTNMNNWNTTFHLKPYPEKGSLDVRWSAPAYPYNFSNYDIQLWHHKNYSIKCRGENLYDEPIKVIPEMGKISLNTTKYLFRNLSRGWYCARITPVDPRCPPDGCEPRSSRAKLLKAGIEPFDIQEIRIDLVPILVGIAAVVLVAGVAVACLVLRCQASRNLFHVAYTKVSVGGGRSRFAETQKILLVWTVAGPDGTHLLPVIQAFKKLLVSYSQCEVYDYLELRSIPAGQREHLLASSTTWLDGLLDQRSVKIIVVGSEGGRYRQLQLMMGGGTMEVVPHLQPQDTQLFPYLLRRLHDRPDIAADYARIFHVRFNDISSELAELEGLVSWTRYRLPQHLRSLTLGLHGIKEDDGTWLEEPTSESLQNLQRVLTGHPLYKCEQIVNNHHTSNHKTENPSAPYLNSSVTTTENQPLFNEADVERGIHSTNSLGREPDIKLPNIDTQMAPVSDSESEKENSSINKYSSSTTVANGTIK